MTDKIFTDDDFANFGKLVVECSKDEDKALKLFWKLVWANPADVLEVSGFNVKLVEWPVPNLPVHAQRLTHAQFDEVKKVYGSDRIVDAIKLIREFSGLGLKDAKDVAEAWLRPHMVRR